MPLHDYSGKEVQLGDILLFPSNTRFRAGVVHNLLTDTAVRVTYFEGMVQKRMTVSKHDRSLLVIDKPYEILLYGCGALQMNRLLEERAEILAKAI